MAGADYILCEVCGSKIVYSPEHQPEAVCKACYDTLKAKAELFDEIIGDVKRIESAQHRGDWMALDDITKEILSKAKDLK